MNDREKAIAAGGIVLVWGAMAAMGLTPVEQFVQVMRDLLIGLGVFSAALANPKE